MTARTPAPCGTLAAHTRHRRRAEPIDNACRDVRNAYQNARKARMRAAKRAAREARDAAVLAARSREVRVVRLLEGGIALGALAGTSVAHGFLPDMHTATSCLSCFGWSNDYRHTHRLWLRRGDSTWN